MKTLCGLILTLACLPLHAQILDFILYKQPAASTQAATPTFSPVAGTYSSTQTVTISAATGGVICYNTTGSPATNGTTGCTTGTLYTGTVSVSTTETLYAVAGGTGYTDSSVGSAAYTISAACTPSDNFTGGTGPLNATNWLTPASSYLIGGLGGETMTQAGGNAVTGVYSFAIALWQGCTMANDQFVQGTITSFSGGVTYLFTRADSSGNADSIYIGSGNITYFTWASGTRTYVGEYDNASVTTGKVYRLDDTGTTLTVSINGSVVYTHSTSRTSGTIGIGISNEASGGTSGGEWSSFSGGTP